MKITGCGIIMALFFCLYSCTEHDIKRKVEDKSKLQNFVERQHAKYVCPMTECPNGYGNKPGKCPDCKMDLVLNKDYIDPINDTIHNN